MDKIFSIACFFIGIAIGYRLATKKVVIVSPVDKAGKEVGYE